MLQMHNERHSKRCLHRVQALGLRAHLTAQALHSAHVLEIRPRRQHV